MHITKYFYNQNGLAFYQWNNTSSLKINLYRYLAKARTATSLERNIDKLERSGPLKLSQRQKYEIRIDLKWKSIY